MPSITLHIRIQTKIKLFNVVYDSFYSMLHPCYTHVTPENCLFWPHCSYFFTKNDLCNHISVFWIDLN